MGLIVTLTLCHTSSSEDSFSELLGENFRNRKIEKGLSVSGCTICSLRTK